MPALTALWKVAGSAAAPAANVTLRDIEVRLWGDAPGERERFPGSYTAALHVGPFVAGLALRNLNPQSQAFALSPGISEDLETRINEALGRLKRDGVVTRLRQQAMNKS
jgi:hypothetical protein